MPAAAVDRSPWRLGGRRCKPMSRHQVGLLIGAGICILALISWVGEIDLGLGQLLDQPTPPAAPAPARSNQPRPLHP